MDMKKGISPLIREELAGAARAGKIPSLQRVRCKLHDEVGEGEEGWVAVELWLRLDGRLIKISRRLQTNDDKDCPGSIDVAEQAFRDALAERWPRIAERLRKTRIGNYTVSDVGDPGGKNVAVSFRIRINGEKDGERSANAAGRNTWRVTVNLLCDAYQWVAWRLLRQTRGYRTGKRSKTRGHRYGPNPA